MKISGDGFVRALSTSHDRPDHLPSRQYWLRSCAFGLDYRGIGWLCPQKDRVETTHGTSGNWAGIGNENSLRHIAPVPYLIINRLNPVLFAGKAGRRTLSRSAGPTAGLCRDALTLGPAPGSLRGLGRGLSPLRRGQGPRRPADVLPQFIPADVSRGGRTSSVHPRRWPGAVPTPSGRTACWTSCTCSHGTGSRGTRRGSWRRRWPMRRTCGRGNPPAGRAGERGGAPLYERVGLAGETRSCASGGSIGPRAGVESTPSVSPRPRFPRGVAALLLPAGPIRLSCYDGAGD